MSWRPHGHARVSARHPEAFAKCDRCGRIDNLVDLAYQHEWAGPKLVNKHLKVCPSCLDQPQPQLRELRLRPDPVPVRDPRPLNNAAVMGGFAVMRRAAIGGPSDFGPEFSDEFEQGTSPSDFSSEFSSNDFFSVEQPPSVELKLYLDVILPAQDIYGIGLGETGRSDGSSTDVVFAPVPIDAPSDR